MTYTIKEEELNVRQFSFRHSLSAPQVLFVSQEIPYDIVLYVNQDTDLFNNKCAMYERKINMRTNFGIQYR